MIAAPLESQLRDSLASRGYYRSPASVPFERFLDAMALLGEIKKPTEIRPQGPNPVLESGRPLLPHNDCNYYADYIVWYCREDGGAGDRTFIVDMDPLYAALSRDDRERLARVRVVLPNHEGGGAPILREREGQPQLFYVPWSLFHRGDPDVAATLRRFHAAVKDHAASARIQGGPIALRTGQFLIVDDARFMHGRDAVPDDAPRHLFRCYVKRHAASACA